VRARLAERLAVNPDQFRKIAYVALAALTVIVFTGAAVRLTDSGLGCPTWPKCYGRVYPPLATHALIEFGNRALSGFVGLITGVVAVLAFTRRPFRRDLAWLALALPLGVVAQAVLGGFTVREKLAPGFVMSHFLLSMVILIAALALVAGTAATAAGPHSGGLVGQHVKRLTIEGPNTLEWAVHQHATIAALFGVATIGVWLLKRKRGAAIDPLEPLTVLGVLLAAQGLIGSVQYELKLPAEMVWIHVALATITWLVTLWAVAVEGALVPRRATVPAARGRAGDRPLSRAA
jgi:cytochrome c oxidase assembly protein subunit 15